MGNPTYEDFKSVFTKYVPEAWLDAWLRSTGLTTLVPTLTLTLTDGEQQQQQQQQQPRVASFTVRQLPPSGSKAATLLPHHVEVGLFDFGPAGLTLRKAVPIDIRPVADEQDFTEAVFGSGDDDSSDRAHPPALVYINYRELTLANCAIDTRSLAFAGLHLDDIVFGAGSAKGKGKDGEEKEDDPDMLLLGMQILESLTFMLKDFRLRPEAFTACVLTVAMEAVRAHPKVRVAIDKAEAAMLSLPKIIPQESPVLAALGKYCAAKFLTGSKAGSEMGEIALRIAERCPKTAEFILTLLLSDGIPRSTAAFWYSVSSLVAWKAIPSLEKLQALAARFYRVAGVDEKEGLRKCTEDVWRASSGNIDDAVALWEECFAKDPEDLFSEASYSGLFMTPNRNCLLELVERKKDEITNPIAVVRLINARETDAEFVDAISKLPICESESIQRYVKRAQAISKGILLTMARYSKVEQPKMK